MRAAPIGAFGAIAFTIGDYGIGTLVNLAALVATFYLTSLIFVLVVLGAVARAVRLLDPQADPLSEGRAAARARHLVVRSGAAGADREDGAGRLRRSRWSGWSCRPAIRSTSTAPTST